MRRSLATLLRSQLKLRAIPRNPNRPADFDRFGLSTTHEARLTAWMRTHLWMAVWVAPKGTRLKSIEDDLKFTWLPPLTLDNGSRWQQSIRAERALMADEARRWAERRGRSTQ